MSELITYEASLLNLAEPGDEIVAGVVRRMPKPSVHQGRVIELTRATLWSQLNRREVEVRKVSGALLIRREPLTFRRPDLSVMLKAGAQSPDGVYSWSPPELIVEVFAKGHVREHLKVLLEDYASIGVPEVWAIDIDRPLFHQFVLEGGRFKYKVAIRKGAICPVRFPSATLRVDTLWDQLPQPNQDRDEEPDSFAG